MYRVRPDTVYSGFPIAAQFAGSILDLRPGTTYEIQLTVTDPDGFNQTLNVTGATRSLPPANPAAGRTVNVSNASQLTAALNNAQPGDVIQLADGVYTGTFSFARSGTAASPIYIRGASRDNTVIDGNNCLPCNGIEVYGSYVVIERLTIRNAERAIRFQTASATGNAVRRVHISNTNMAIAGRDGQTDFYIADNTMEGRLAWPLTYRDDGGASGNNEGISLTGDGHAVYHNRISGYSDAMKNYANGWQACDFIGNDVLWTYDNAIELDEGSGNIRFGRNRMTNTYMPVSLQPGFAGPFYVYRNVIVNSASEQLKIHSLAGLGQATNGLLFYNNTLVSPYYSLLQQGDSLTAHSRLLNNLFIGPVAPRYTMNWYGPVTPDLELNYNGYWPDGAFTLAMQYNGSNFSAFQKTGREANGKLLSGQILQSGLVGMTSHLTKLDPQDVTLAAGSPAIDAGTNIPGFTGGYTGAAPDLGALELGCPAPVYGPRADGIDESNENLGCGTSAPVTTTPTPAPTPQPPAAAPTPASLLVLSGNAQSVTTGGTFAPVSVLVKDSAGSPVANVVVTFASASSSVVAATNSSGVASALPPVSTASAGTFQVNASAASLPAAAFTLTVTAPATTPTGGSSSVSLDLSAPASAPAGSGIVLTSKVIGITNGVWSSVGGGTVNFTLNNAPIASASVVSGVATANATIASSLTPGNYILGAQFSGYGQFPAGTVSVFLTVTAPTTTTTTKTTPVLSWPKPVAITQGTPLSSTQLNALSSVPGTFAYSPGAGTVLQAGAGQTLTATFTPADPTKYNSATVNTTIDVTSSTSTAPATNLRTSLDVAVSPTPAVVGSTVTLTSHVLGISTTNTWMQGGTVTFTLNGVTVATAPVVNGTASTPWAIPTSTAKGSFILSAQFSGWNGYPASTVSIFLSIN